VRISPTCIQEKQFSQELTLTQDLGSRTDLILGALYLHEVAGEPLELDVPSIGFVPRVYVIDPEQKLASYAAYTQIRHRLTDNLRTSAGVRYTKDQKQYYEVTRFFGMGAGKKSWAASTPRLAMDYR